MKKIMAVIILLSFAAPARADLVTDFDPVERNLIERQQQETEKKRQETEKKRLEDEMSREYKKPAAEPVKAEPAAEKKGEKAGSNWWKWALGVVVVGGVIAAASGGNGGDSGGGDTGSVTVSW